MPDEMPELSALDTVFASVSDSRLGEIRFRGIIVECRKRECIVALPGRTVKDGVCLTGVTVEDFTMVDETSVMFLALPTACLSKVRPDGWGMKDTMALRPWPAQPSRLIDAFLEQDGEPMSASGVETGESHEQQRGNLRGSVPNGPMGAAASASSSNPRHLSKFHTPLGDLLERAAPSFNIAAGGSDEEDEEDDAEWDGMAHQINMKINGDRVAPLEVGAAAPSARSEKRQEASKSLLNQLPDLVATGKLEPKDAIFLEILRELRDDKKSKKKTGRSPEDEESEEDSSDGDSKQTGLRAFNDVDKVIAHEVKCRPSKLIREFEDEARKELGVKPGMPYNVLDVRKARYWGRHTTLQRSAALDLETYVLLAATPNPCLQVRRSMAQLIQNFRAKHQAALDGGSWVQASLLTGTEDVCSKRRWAAPARQISAVANFVKATSDLSKQMGSQMSNFHRQQEGDHADHEESPATTTSMKKKKKKGGGKGKDGEE